MAGSIVIVAPGLRRETIRLQPWRYVSEIAGRLAKKRTVKVITDGSGELTEECWPEGYTIVRTPDLSTRRQRALCRLVNGFEPEQLWWSVTPRSVGYFGLLKAVRCEKYAFITCPFYSYRHLLDAHRAGVPLSEYKALWLQRVVPRTLFAALLAGDIFRKIFVQSEANRQELARIGVSGDKTVLLRVGIDRQEYGMQDTAAAVWSGTRRRKDDAAVMLLYFGAARKIRGFDALIGAFTLLRRRGINTELQILARNADEAETAALRRRLSDVGVLSSATVIGGWLNRPDVLSQIAACDIVVLPFILAQSDVPIAYLEAMASGKPVVGPAIDGIPELVVGHGMIASSLDPGELAKALTILIEDRDERVRLGQSARRFMQTYPDWQQIGDQLLREVGLA